MSPVSQQPIDECLAFAYILRNVVQNVRLQRHIHVYGACYPAKLSLPYIKHTIDLVYFISCYL